jgi:hypothetical protein
MQRYPRGRPSHGGASPTADRIWLAGMDGQPDLRTIITTSPDKVAETGALAPLRHHLTDWREAPTELNKHLHEVRAEPLIDDLRILVEAKRQRVLEHNSGRVTVHIRRYQRAQAKTVHDALRLHTKK